MIESIAVTNQQTPKSDSDRQDQSAAGVPLFSFQSALTAISARAAASLETFGGAPQTNGFQVSAQSDANRNAPVTAQQHAATEKESATQPAASSPKAETGSPDTVKASAAPSPQQTVLSAETAALNVNIAANQLLASSATQRSAAQSMDLAAPARTHDVKTAALRKAETPLPAQPSARTEEFARLIAEKMQGGATRFELRLDPPELGRVEAQLNLSEDGDNVLALKFENQSALDLFARDQSALRHVLAAAGFELGQEQLSFTLSQDQQHNEQSAAMAPADASNIFNASLEALSAHSRGVVDIWI